MICVFVLNVPYEKWLVKQLPKLTSRGRPTCSQEHVYDVSGAHSVSGPQSDLRVPCWAIRVTVMRGMYRWSWRVLGLQQ